MLQIVQDLIFLLDTCACINTSNKKNAPLTLRETIKCIIYIVNTHINTCNGQYLFQIFDKFLAYNEISLTQVHLNPAKLNLKSP